MRNDPEEAWLVQFSRWATLSNEFTEGCRPVLRA
jgi:hypothetical protein